MAAQINLTVGGIRHPDYLFDAVQWAEWRATFAGGEEYLQTYLKRFSDRETHEEYNIRKACTPIPTFAKAALLDVRNSIFQRLSDVTRIGGSDAYQRAVKGEGAGVDRTGASMNSFVGIDVLTELLVMGRVGVYVDAPAAVPTTQAEKPLSPYVYVYRVEDILSWTAEDPDKPGQFKAVLLRDHCVKYNTDFGGVELPTGPRETRTRLIWKDDVTGKVHYRMYDKDEKPIMYPDSDATGTVQLDIETIPFIMPSIGDSLMKDVASYQKTLLNILSRAVDYDLRSNTPFLTIQQELGTAGAHLKKPGVNGAVPGGQPAKDQEERIGSGAGRYYDKGMERPDFVAPPTEPLLASIRLQEKLEDDIRKLINLSVAGKAGSRTESAEAKKLSSQGLEAGLSYIGLVLQQCEQKIAQYWAAYEDYKKPNSATIAYPQRYILKEDGERIEEAKGLIALIDDLPCELARKAVAKQIITLLLGGKVSAQDIAEMHAEVDKNGYTSANLERLTMAIEKGLVGKELASKAMGFQKGEVEKARKDREEDVQLTVLAQTKAAAAAGGPALGGALKNPEARGVPAGGADPDAAKKEQAAGRESKE